MLRKRSEWYKLLLSTLATFLKQKQQVQITNVIWNLATKKNCITKKDLLLNGTLWTQILLSIEMLTTAVSTLLVIAGPSSLVGRNSRPVTNILWTPGTWSALPKLKATKISTLPENIVPTATNFASSETASADNVSLKATLFTITFCFVSQSWRKLGCLPTIAFDNINKWSSLALLRNRHLLYRYLLLLGVCHVSSCDSFMVVVFQILALPSFAIVQSLSFESKSMSSISLLWPFNSHMSSNEGNFHRRTSPSKPPVAINVPFEFIRTTRCNGSLSLKSIGLCN